jgi:hypothetical protein
MSLPRPLLSIANIWAGRNVPVLLDNNHVGYRYSRKAYPFALILWLLHVVRQKSDSCFESGSLTSPRRVPAFMTSCGSLTTAQVTDQLPSNEPAPPNIPRRQANVQCDISTQKTTPNWCNTSVRLLLFPLLLKHLSNHNLLTNVTQQPVRDSNGNHYTVTIFVPTNCGNASTGTDNAGPLPSSYQNAIYVQPGVAVRPVPAG